MASLNLTPSYRELCHKVNYYGIDGRQKNVQRASDFINKCFHDCRIKEDLTIPRCEYFFKNMFCISF